MAKFVKVQIIDMSNKATETYINIENIDYIYRDKGEVYMVQMAGSDITIKVQISEARFGEIIGM